ncbi:hypothetical protein GCM10023156_54120 [Novipirellula rosea]|uniref:Integrase catalytic domain-containing protein n=1 Tax=Novipirellula rosea TaxID=1031540 RepID=A0ABP8NHN4_9BACT
MFRSSECEIKLTPIRSLNLQARVERVIQTIKHGELNAFFIVINKHLDGILRVTQEWYNKRRGHSARDHLPPVRDEDSPPTIDLKQTKIECHTELGGLLMSYRPSGISKR